MAQYLSPLGSLIDEAAVGQFLTPDGSLLEEQGVVTSETALSVIASTSHGYGGSAIGPSPAAFSFGATSQFTGIYKILREGAAQILAALGTNIWSGAQGASGSTFSFVGTSSVGWQSNITQASYTFLTPHGDLLIDDTSSLTYLTPSGLFVTELTEGAQEVIGQTSFSFVATSVPPGGAAMWAGHQATGGAANFNASDSVLWKPAHEGFAITPVATVVWQSEVGAALWINDDQTEVAPTGASIANSELVVVASGTVQWDRTQVPAEQPFEIIGTSAVTFVAASRGDSAVSIVAATAFDAVSGINEVGTGDVVAAATVTWDTQELQPNGYFGINAAGRLDWLSLEAIQAPTEVNIAATSLLEWNPQEVTPPITEFVITPAGLVVWRSTPDPRREDDDDESEDERRRIWSDAAEAERKLAMSGIYDDDDLAVLSMALVDAYQKYRGRLQ